MSRSAHDRRRSSPLAEIPRAEQRGRRVVAAVASLLLAFVAALALPLPVGAQTPSPGAASAQGNQAPRPTPPWRMTVQADNDAFNFWRPITDRPDKEYTNGDEVSFEASAAPWWGRRFARRRMPCTGLEDAGARCLTTVVSLGQDMYTPRPDHEPRVVPDWRNERPYAAWLYVGAEARVISERSLRSVGLDLGVTGPPALGEMAQKTAHKLTGVYSREPIGWDTQIGFEPGVMISYRETWRFAGRTPSGAAVVDVVPHVGASLGNVLTDAETGFRARVGINLSNPWWMTEWRTRPAAELYLLGGVRAAAVAHNITLDGNTLGAERSVDRTPFVGEYSFGVGGRFRGLVAEWRAVTRSREYRTGPGAHAFSTLFAGFEVPTR